jgi:hypothetical protein
VTALPAVAEPSRAGASRYAIVGLILLAGTAVLVAEAMVTSDRPTTAVVWGGLALFAFALALLCLVRPDHQPDLGLARWKLGSWILLWYGIVFGVATVTWSQPQTGVPGQIEVTSVLRALWLVGAGIAAWSLGRRVGPGHGLRRGAARAVGALDRRFAADIRSPAAPWILYGVGIAARLAGTATTGTFGFLGNPSALVSSSASYAGILGALTLCAPLGLSAAALQVFRERRRSARFTLAILFASELTLGAIAGNKATFIVAVLAVVIPYNAVRRRLPKVALIVLGLVFLIVVIPFNQAYRGTVRQSSVTLSPGQAISAAPTIFRQTLTGQSPLSVLPDSFDFLMQRVRQIDSPAIIVQRTPSQIGYLSPVQLIDGPLIGMVPRALWPGKPILVTGYQFNQEYFGLPSTLYTSTGETTIGSLYLHGGWLPAMIGMFLLGCGVRLIEDVIDVRVSPHAVYLVVLLFPSLVQGEDDWQTVLVSVPGTLLVWVLAVALSFRSRRLEAAR